ncbi:MAG TPA: ABC transporter substrate-binding protein [Myxococcota bacterium]|nr:ABC transporter substrate-binding protein [Myxococcota bacterium]
MRRAARFASVLVALWLFACASEVPQRPASPEEQGAYATVQKEVARGGKSARASLSHFIEQFPESPLANQARMQRGDLLLAAGDSDAAFADFEEVVRRVPRSDQADAARVRIARIELSRGDARGARDTLDRVRLPRLSPADRAAAYDTWADASSDGVARVLWLSKLRSETPQAADAIDGRIELTLSGLKEPELARLAKEVGDAPPAASVALARAELLLDAGDVEAARASLARAESLPLAPALSERLKALRQRLAIRVAAKTEGAPLPDFGAAEANGLPQTSGSRGAIGVVLPLSGQYASFGEESLRGVLLAAGVFGAGDAPGSPPPLRVVVRDTQGQPAVAAAAVRELAADGEVSAIIGPLVSAECEAAAAAAQEAGIPLLALTAREEVVRDRSWVFRLRTRPVEEVDLVVDKARALGAARFAILYRDDAYGRGLRSLFWDAVEAHGGQVVGVASYPPGAKDFTDPIRSLVGYSLLDDEEKALLAQREKILNKARRLPPTEALVLRAQAQAIQKPDGSPLPPIVDFDALFVPDTTQSIVLIAPHLAFQEVNGVRLLGPEGWYQKDLARLAGDHLEGAIFAAHFFPDSPVDYVHDFTVHYRDAFASEPAVFAAQAYDAANLALVQLARRSATRDSMRQGILETAGYPGVAGVTTVGSDGNAHKRPYLLQVEHGEIVQVD